MKCTDNSDKYVIAYVKEYFGGSHTAGTIRTIITATYFSRTMLALIKQDLYIAVTSFVCGVFTGIIAAHLKKREKRKLSLHSWLFRRARLHEKKPTLIIFTKATVSKLRYGFK